MKLNITGIRSRYLMANNFASSPRQHRAPPPHCVKLTRVRLQDTSPCRTPPPRLLVALINVGLQLKKKKYFLFIYFSKKLVRKRGRHVSLPLPAQSPSRVPSPFYRPSHREARIAVHPPDPQSTVHLASVTWTFLTLASRSTNAYLSSTRARGANHGLAARRTPGRRVPRVKCKIWD